MYFFTYFLEQKYTTPGKNKSILPFYNFILLTELVLINKFAKKEINVIIQPKRNSQQLYNRYHYSELRAMPMSRRTRKRQRNQKEPLEEDESLLNKDFDTVQYEVIYFDSRRHCLIKDVDSHFYFPYHTLFSSRTCCS